MDLNTAIDVIESTAGFTDTDTSVGEAWAAVLAQLQAAPVPAGEDPPVDLIIAAYRSGVDDARIMAETERQAAPVPVASDTRYEFSVYDEDYTEQAGGSAPTYSQALSEGQHYLAQYQRDGSHTLEVRRVEVLHPDALPVLPEGVHVIEPAERTILVPVPVPVAVSERLPGAKDCDEGGRVWWLGVETWMLRTYALVEGAAIPLGSHWLPAHALPLPTPEPQP